MARTEVLPVKGNGVTGKWRRRIALAAVFSIASGAAMTELIEAGGTLLSGGAGKIYATAMKDGKELWSLPTPGSVEDLAFQGGRLFAVSDRGAVSCFASGEKGDTQ